MKSKYGVVHGRFQVFHNGHLHYLMLAKERCEHLIVGIANPDILLTKHSDNDPHRSKSSANPLSYYDRMQCIKNTLLEAGLKREEFDIVPFPINYPEKIVNYCPKYATYYMTIFDSWGEEKLHHLRDELKLDVNVLMNCPIEEKDVSATMVREKIHNGEDWSYLVPRAVYNYILEHNLDLIISRAFDDDSEFC